MAVSWPSGVNQDAYGMDTSGGDNVEYTDFESGKKRTHLLNTTPKKQFSFMLNLNDDGAGSEYKLFVAWWEQTLLSGSLSFLFPDLITHSSNTEYLATEAYSVTGQLNKEVTLTVEEM